MMIRSYARLLMTGPRDFSGGYVCSFAFEPNNLQALVGVKALIGLTPLYGANGDEVGDTIVTLDGPHRFRFQRPPTKLRFAPQADSNGAAITGYLDLFVGNDISDEPGLEHRNYSRGGTIPVVIHGFTQYGEPIPVPIDDNGNLAVGPSDPPPATATNIARYASSVNNVVLRVANATMKGVMIYNDSTANLYLKLGVTASLTSWSVKLGPGGYFETPYRYIGEIDGIWDAANGFAYVTTISP